MGLGAMNDDQNQGRVTGGSGQEAQQALDDLTVLTNVQTPDMGQARLSAAPTVETVGDDMSALATIH